MQAFKNFVFAFEAAPGVVAVEVARSILNDIFQSDAGSLDKWSAFLTQMEQKMAVILGVSQRSPFALIL